jgi:uncharacterized spore protein YtfJ
MNNNLNEMLGKLTDFLKNEAKTETVIGQQFQLGEFKCIPVIGIGFGLGAGGGEGKGLNPKQGEGEGSGVGGGAGMGMGPLGFLVTRGDQIQFIPTRQSKGFSAAIEKLPDLMDKYFEKSRSSKKEVSVA